MIDQWDAADDSRRIEGVLAQSSGPPATGRCGSATPSSDRMPQRCSGHGGVCTGGDEPGHEADVGDHAEDFDEGLGDHDGRGECQPVG
jgi:hypothetical protein